MALELSFFIFLQFIFILTLIGALVNCACWKNITGGHDRPNLQNNSTVDTQITYDRTNDNVAIDCKWNGTDSYKENQTGNRRRLPELPPNCVERTPPTDGTSELYAIVDEPRINVADHASPSSQVKDKVSTLRSQTIDTDSETYDHLYLPGSSQANPTQYGDASFCEPPPPVPEKHFGDDNQDALYSTIFSRSAASAIAGQGSVENIPYITSPVIGSEEVLNIDYTRESPSSILDYNFISVREPLENIRAQTNALEGEPHYSVVPDDGDQTYAEIESAQNSASSSYGCGHLVVGKASSDSVPPDPPPVERLRSVAQAHSRQASCSSFISNEATSSHSPVSDRGHGSWIGYPRSVQDFSDMYSTVDKSKKSSAPPLVLEFIPPVNEMMEELYAKVRKTSNRNVVEEWPGARPKHSLTGGSQTKRHSWASNHKVSSSDSENALERSANDEREMGNEPLHSSPKWSNHLNSGNPDGRLLGGDGNADRRSPPSESYFQGRKFANSIANDLVTPAESPYCTYELVHRKAGFDDEESEPGYEKVTQGHGLDDESADPGYEMVTNRNFQVVDPNYESIHYSNVSEARNLDRQDESSYWQIPLRVGNIDPLYERINSQEDDSTDPNYEKVKTGSELSFETSEPGYERVKQHNLSEDGYGYQKVKDATDMLTTESCDPGYEMIQSNIVELHVKWYGNDASESDGAGATTHQSFDLQEVYSDPILKNTNPEENRVNDKFRNEVSDLESIETVSSFHEPNNPSSSYKS